MLHGAIFASGNGSNFEALVRYFRKKKKPSLAIKLLIVDKKDAFARTRAHAFNIPEVFVNPRNYPSKLLFEQAIETHLVKYQIQIVLLAGYMRIISPYLLKLYPSRILNIHPSILPEFPGTDAIQRAFHSRKKTSGITVHIVDEKIDHGPIILQQTVERRKDDTLESFENKMHTAEHALYPKAVELFIKNHYGRK